MWNYDTHSKGNLLTLGTCDWLIIKRCYFVNRSKVLTINPMEYSENKVFYYQTPIQLKFEVDKSTSKGKLVECGRKNSLVGKI